MKPSLTFEEWDLQHPFRGSLTGETDYRAMRKDAFEGRQPEIDAQQAEVEELKRQAIVNSEIGKRLIAEMDNTIGNLREELATAEERAMGAALQMDQIVADTRAEMQKPSPCGVAGHLVANWDTYNSSCDVCGELREYREAPIREIHRHWLFLKHERDNSGNYEHLNTRMVEAEYLEGRLRTLLAGEGK